MSDLLPNPCHLLDTRWHGLDAGDGYDSIEVDIEVETDPGPTAHYYYANTVYFPGAGVDGSGALHGVAYAGLQTNGYSGPEDGWVGKMALFSVWDGVAGVPGDRGWASPFDETGRGHSVRVPYRWRRGIPYRLRIFAGDDEGSGRWWSAALLDPVAGVETEIGSVLVAARAGGIRRPVTFHERYAGPSRTIEDIEGSQVSFTHMTANGGRVGARRWEHTRVVDVAGGGDWVWHEDLPNGVRTAAGVQRPGASAGG